MSTPALGIVATIVWLALIFVGAIYLHPPVHDDEAERNRNNARVRQVYIKSGLRWYPHELAGGRVRWYNVDDDPMEL